MNKIIARIHWCCRVHGFLVVRPKSPWTWSKRGRFGPIFLLKDFRIFEVAGRKAGLAGQARGENTLPEAPAQR